MALSTLLTKVRCRGKIFPHYKEQVGDFGEELAGKPKERIESWMGGIPWVKALRNWLPSM